MSAANTFGQVLKITTFGESHGPAYGVVIDGLPSGIIYKEEILIQFLNRRKPGQDTHTTARNELDQPEILSGIYENKTLGTPISVIVRNTNQQSGDYADIQKNPRIGHADDVWINKYGHVDYRGGGRSSGRETLTRVIAGAFAKMFTQQLYPQVDIQGWASQIAHFQLHKSNELTSEVKNFLSDAKTQGESYGGVVQCQILNPPKSLGQPVFHKFKADLASAMMGIGATTGFEIGDGFESVKEKGTDFHQTSDSKFYGGLRGGITTGEDIHFKVAFKPTSSIKDVAKKGRHDPCIVPRAIPVVEAMAWIVLADHVLWRRLDQIES